MTDLLFATDVNNTGKIEKNAKVKSGTCIFPFKYKYEEHDTCIDTNKGAICATEINPKTNTLVKYGYCPSIKKNPKKGTHKKALLPTSTKKFLKKLTSKSSTKRIASKSKSKSTSKSTSKSNSSQKRKTIRKMDETKKPKTLKKRKLVIVSNLKPITSIVQEEPKMKVYNEELIDVLGELSSILQRQGEPFKARAYQKGQETIMTYDGDITNPEQLKGLPGIGDAIFKKMKEYMETGKIAVLERERNNPMNVLTNIYGVGPKKARQLIDDGFVSIEKIRSLSPVEINAMFNANQQKGLEYYDDINQKIPRDDIIKFDDLFYDVIQQCCGTATNYEIVGSYRRGKQMSGDIDVIITNENDNKSVFTTFLDDLKKRGILEHTFSKGPTKSLTMCRLTPESKVARRVDFLYTSPEEYPFAILYFTGSKIFNTVMRQRALKMGYTLNEHGLSHMKSGVKGAKVDHNFKTERDIFDFLDMKYKAPNERIDGRAVQDKDKETLMDDANVPSKTITTLYDRVENVKSIMPNAEELSSPPKKKIHVVKRTTLKKKLKETNVEMTNKFKTDGISFLEGLSEDQIINLIQQANDAYYNKTPFFTDEEFDIVKEFAERKFPNNDALKAIGAPVEKGKIKLPFNMPSMNKIKPDTDALTKWKAKYKGPYVISAKLDGVSGMYVLDGKKAPKLYTRGDGKYGQDISHIIPYLTLPTTTTDKLVIRGEFIIQKSVFTNRYANEFSNPRNFIAGLINSKTKIPEKYRSMDFVAYEVIKPELSPEDQFTLLDRLNVDVVYNKIVQRDQLTNELLSDELVKLRDTYKYEIDGVIVANNAVYKRTPDNPEHAFAFKMVLSDQVAEVKVLDVLWSPSKDGYLKPRVQVEPVVLGGARIEFATGFNAKFIEDNKIGVGAIIQLVRSGDVIPHILSVVKPAEKAMMPQVPWKWNATHVDAVLEDKTHDETVVIKTITLFFKHLDTSGMGPGNVAKIVAAGLNTLPKVIHATEPELQSILGKKTGQMASTNIHKSIQNASLPLLMTATNIFGRGFGEKRFVSIIEEIPDVLNTSMTKEQLVAKVENIKGFSKTTAQEFAERLPEFQQFIQDAKLEEKIMAMEQNKVKQKGDVNHPLYGKKVVMSGFRDKSLMSEIQSKGAEMVGNVSKNTFVLIVKDKDEDTGKIDKAKELGVMLMTPDEFKSNYL